MFDNTDELKSWLTDQLQKPKAEGVDLSIVKFGVKLEVNFKVYMK